MSISSPLFQWDQKTQELCIDNMRWISQPMSWAVSKISSHQRPHSIICPLVIELLRRLNLPIVYLASEITLVCCIANALLQKVVKAIIQIVDRSIAFDQNILLTACECGELIGILAVRRVELICTIIWQILFGAVKIATKAENWLALNPIWPITSSGSIENKEERGIMPKEKERRAIELLQNFHLFTRERKTAFSSSSTKSKSPDVNDTTATILPGSRPLKSPQSQNALPPFFGQSDQFLISAQKKIIQSSKSAEQELLLFNQSSQGEKPFPKSKNRSATDFSHLSHPFYNPCLANKPIDPISNQMAASTYESPQFITSEQGERVCGIFKSLPNARSHNSSASKSIARRKLSRLKKKTC